MIITNESNGNATSPVFTFTLSGEENDRNIESATELRMLSCNIISEEGNMVYFFEPKKETLSFFRFLAQVEELSLNAFTSLNRMRKREDFELNADETYELATVFYQYATSQGEGWARLEKARAHNRIWSNFKVTGVAGRLEMLSGPYSGALIDLHGHRAKILRRELPRALDYPSEWFDFKIWGSYGPKPNVHF